MESKRTQIEKAARSYYYAAKNPRKARESAKMAKLEKAWQAVKGDAGYTFGDVLA